MKPEIITQEEALKKVKEALKRIEKEKAVIIKELEKTEAELEARATGEKKSGGFELLNITESTETLTKKVAKIKEVLEQPNYADEEFRKYSLLYLKGELAEHQEKRGNVNREIGDLNHELVVIPQKILELEKKRNSIIDEFARKFYDIGLTEETTCIGLYGAEFILDRYETKCNEYENN